MLCTSAFYDTATYVCICIFIYLYIYVVQQRNSVATSEVGPNHAYCRCDNSCQCFSLGNPSASVALSSSDLFPCYLSPLHQVEFCDPWTTFAQAAGSVQYPAASGLQQVMLGSSQPGDSSRIPYHLTTQSHGPCYSIKTVCKTPHDDAWELPCQHLLTFPSEH